MKLHHVEQGTPAWQALRLGIPTASMFNKIVTPTGKVSAQSAMYANRLAAERFLRRPLDDIGNLFWVERGKDMEPDAVLAYEFERDVKTAKVGFVTTDDGRIGASPDRLLVDVPGAVEIKCPAPATHVAYLDQGFGKDYWCQVQGQLMVTGLEWIDRVSYYPGLPLVCERTARDEAYIALLRDSLNVFCANLDALVERLRAKGAIECEAS